MELKTSNGMSVVSIEEITQLRDVALRTRKTVIVYNKTKKEDVLNTACRLCNDLITCIDKVFGGA